MSEGTTIEWTDATWNPLRASVNDGAGVGWACVRVSQGCVNCYAATINKRLGTGLDYTVPALAKVATYVDEKALTKPLGWRKPRRVFVCSMTDLFGEWVTDSEIERVFSIMWKAERHTFQVLTKRPERMRQFMSDLSPAAIPRNVWLGTSVENQATADERIPRLMETPAAVRFLSCEPLLERIYLPTLTGALDWVIVGGESGPRARPFDPAWARSLVQQCRGAGITPFVKQMGSNWSYDENAALPRPKSMRESHGRDMEEWPMEIRVREWPVSSPANTQDTQLSKPE